MELEKIPEGAVQVGSHWGWEESDDMFYGWADENGYLHREGAPAEIQYRKDGTIERESWYLHGQLHRESAPAEIDYREDETISRESWHFHGQLHREGAPAIIYYHDDGNYYNYGTIKGEYWRLFDDKIEPLYPLGVYQEMRRGIGGHEAMCALPGNLIPLLSGFFG